MKSALICILIAFSVASCQWMHFHPKPSKPLPANVPTTTYLPCKKTADV